MDDTGLPVSRKDIERLRTSVGDDTSDPHAGIFGPCSISWKVNRESALFLGAGRAALLQLAHPWVASALHQHSNLRTDPLARFHNTFRVVFTMVSLEWTNGPYPNKTFQSKWEKVINEWSRRWEKKVTGWWFDGCYFPNSMYRSADPPNFVSFAAAARAGNPNSVVAFNPGVIYRMISITPSEDYTAGEIDKPDLITVRRAADGRIDGTQIHMLSVLGERWGSGAPRFTTEQVVEYTRKN
jgi:ER-bound oxygenase mpaB/B'/Rubber oxygenase, catalytic domain